MIRNTGFEEAIHGFAARLGCAEGPSEVEAALVELVEAIVPLRRVFLVRGAPPRELRTRPGRGPLEALELIKEELAFQGRSRPGLKPGRRAMRARERRRLKTACALASLALERLRHHAEWDRAELDAGDGPGPEADGQRQCAAPVLLGEPFLSAVLPFAMSQARRHREPLAILCLGIDRRDAIRELMGQTAIDRLLEAICRFAVFHVRASDMVARLDDDRVVVLLAQCHGPDAERIARSLVHAIAERTCLSTELAYATISIGAAECPSDAVTAGALVAMADDALARAQARGAGQIVRARSRPVLVASQFAEAPSARA